MQIISPFIHTPCYCEACGGETIMLMTDSDRAINYPSIIENNDMMELNRILNMSCISYMMCKKCNTKYMIDWTDRLPKPLYNLTPALTIL